MEKRLKAKVEHVRRLVSKPATIEEEEGEASGAAAARLSRCASQLLLSENPAIPSSPRESSLLPPPPPKTNEPRAPPSSSSSSSSLVEGRHYRGWTKGLKGKKGEKYFFRIKAPCVKECLFRQDVTEPWDYLANKSEDLRV
jgi:hypothetical protein